MSLGFLLALIDSWDGTELFQVTVDGAEVFSHWFSLATADNSSYVAPLPAAGFALRGNAPNPFNPSTRIFHELPTGGARVTLGIHDLSGRLVRTLVDGGRPDGPIAAWRRRLVVGALSFCRCRCQRRLAEPGPQA